MPNMVIIYSYKIFKSIIRVLGLGTWPLGQPYTRSCDVTLARLGCHILSIVLAATRRIILLNNICNKNAIAGFFHARLGSEMPTLSVSPATESYMYSYDAVFDDAEGAGVCLLEIRFPAKKIYGLLKDTW